MPAPDRPQNVYTLLVEVGRKSGDGLPDGATGAGLLCFATGCDEEEAVRETVAVLREAGLAPLEVTGHGSLEERLAAGERIDAAERALMDRAVAENAVIVAELTAFGREQEDEEGEDAEEADGAEEEEEEEDGEAGGADRAAPAADGRGRPGPRRRPQG
jgi:hypothetical protein